MNFFQHQDTARKKTSLLLFLLVMAVLCLIAITAFSMAALSYFFQSHVTSIAAANAYSTSFAHHVFNLIHSKYMLWIALGVFTVVTGGAVYKFSQLSGGGRKVAEALGGRLISPNSVDVNQRKILNIVEEMAIASGNPVPQVYLLEEAGINAFAAGLNRRDTIIGVTQGCIESLTRDELQGVIAHEFSHIHNGDMRLNMRLVAVLHGILIIGLIGNFIMRGSYYRNISGRGDKNRGQQVAFGLALVIIGYGGTFFGNIIKAAVSRQREFLADASAVQFTRNPSGISGALKKIGGHTVAGAASGSHLQNALATEFSHMYFAQGVKLAFRSWMATHPALSDRIKRIEPKWDGKFLATHTEHKKVGQNYDQPHKSFDNSAPRSDLTYNEPSPSLTSNQINIEVLDNIGGPQSQHINYAAKFINDLPLIIYRAAQQPFTARALIYCLLLDANPTIAKMQIQHLHDNAHPATFREMDKLIEQIKNLKRDNFLNLIDLCIPALKQLSPRQHSVFKANLKALIQADRKITIFEWCLYRIVLLNTENARINRHLKSLTQLRHAAILLLNVVATSGDNSNASTAFNNGIKALGSGFTATTVNPSTFSLNEIDSALTELNHLKPLEKPKLLKALLVVINTDQKVTSIEAELFRAIADTLECPMPPIKITE